MAQQQVSRRHHIVPRFYLERFADERNQLRQVWLPGDRRHNTTVTNATVVSDYYNLVDDAGELDDFWEQQFSAIEGRAAEAIRAVVERGEDGSDPETRYAISVFLALQHLRSSSIRDQAAELRSAFLKLQTAILGIEKLREVMEEGLGRDVGDGELDAEWQDLTQPGGTQIVVPVADHIAHIVDLIDPATEQFMVSGWTVWRFASGGLITSDTPVTIVRAAGHPPGWGVGLATAGGFTVPLSRDVALTVDVTKSSDSAAPEMELLDELATTMFFNMATANTARKILLTHPDDEFRIAFDLHEPVERESEDMGPRHVRREGGFGRAPGEEAEVGAEAEPILATYETFRIRRSPIFPPDVATDEPIPHYTWPLEGRTFVNPHSL